MQQNRGLWHAIINRKCREGVAHVFSVACHHPLLLFYEFTHVIVACHTLFCCMDAFLFLQVWQLAPLHPST